MVVRRSREEWKIYGNVFDKFTLEQIEILRSKGHFEELKSAVALGKEANIFTAHAPEPTIVKIYRLENRDFTGMLGYLVQDPRYIHVKRRKREIVFAWTQREYRNLLLAREALTVPKPIAYKANILVMEQIGFPDPAPKLKDAKPKDPQVFFESVCDGMKRLWKLGLVHGDLSDFNILNDNEQPVFIDFSQSSPITAPNAEELWQRDVKNIIKAASRAKLVLTEEHFKR